MSTCCLTVWPGLSSDLQEMVDVVDHHQLFVKIEKAFPECDEEGCLKIYENVLRCVGNKQYVCDLLFSATINVFLSFSFFYNIRISTNSIQFRNVKYYFIIRLLVSIVNVLTLFSCDLARVSQYFAINLQKTVIF